MSGALMSAVASATRLACPPDSWPMVRCRKGVQPSLSRMVCTSASMPHASAASISGDSFASCAAAASSPPVAAASAVS
jgi:hypothetical protein